MINIEIELEIILYQQAIKLKGRLSRQYTYHARGRPLVVAYIFVRHMQCTCWRYQMETFSASLAICAVTGEFPAQRPVTQSFDVFFDLRLDEGLSKQSWGWWFEAPSRPLWHHIN